MTNIKKKNLYFLGYIFASKILALIIIVWKFGLFESSVSKSYKISMWLTIALIWFVFSFWESVSIFIRDMKEGVVREILHSISSLLLPFLLWISGVLAYNFISDYLFFTGTILVTSMLGTFFRAKHNYFRRQVLIDRGYVNVLK